MRKAYKEQKKPLYYSEYINENINEDKTNKYKFYLTFLILTTVFVFLPSISDLIYSYMKLDKCQEMTDIIPIMPLMSLNNWYRFTGIYSLIYYSFIVISMYFLYIKNNNDTYSRLYNISEINETETHTYFFKIFSTIFTLFLLTVQSILFYVYFEYFNHYCNSLTIIIYMWIRLLSGTLSSLFIIFFLIMYI